MDPFGHSVERKTERRLIDDYVALVDDIGSSLNSANAQLALEIMNWPNAVRGYGHVKERKLAESLTQVTILRQKFTTVPASLRMGERGGERASGNLELVK